MPTSKRASIADVLKDADDLLTSIANNAELLGEMDTTKLEAAMTAYRPHIARQINFNGERQMATHELRSALKEMREAAFFLRAAIRGRLGPRHPKLIEFGIIPTPERRTRRAKAKPSTNPPTEPGGPTTPPPTPVP